MRKKMLPKIHITAPSSAGRSTLYENELFNYSQQDWVWKTTPQKTAKTDTGPMPPHPHDSMDALQQSGSGGDGDRDWWAMGCVFSFGVVVTIGAWKLGSLMAAKWAT